MEHILAIIILASVLVQGGFYPTIFLGAALLLSLLSLPGRIRRLDRCDGALWGLAGAFLLASLANGYASQSLSQACLPGACAVFIYLYRGLPERKKAGVLRVLLLGSGVLAGAAVLAFCGVLPLAGAVSSRRLQFTFQYANAAGSWFAVTALLAQDGRESRRFLMPMLSALFLTRSVGALGLYAVFQLVRLWRRREERLWPETVLSHVTAAVFAAAFFFADGWLSIPLLAALYAAGWYWERLQPLAQRVHLQWAALLAGGAGVAAALFSQRFSAGLRSLAERLVQILDGLRAIAAHPLLGLGAGNWETAYPYYQSAQYSSTVVHSSVIQIGVDAGIFAVILAAAFLLLAWRRGRGRRMEAGFLALHSLLDFTMQFLPIALLLLVLLFAGEESAPDGKKNAWRLLPLSFGFLCAVLLWSQMEYKQLAYGVQTQSWEAVAERYEHRRSLFGGSPAARSAYLQALYGQGDLRGVLEAAEGAENLRLEELALYARALRELEGEEAACTLLLGVLEEQIYRVSLFEQTAALFREWEVDAAWRERYDRLADRANDSQTILGSLKGDQVYIEHI